MKKEVLKPKFKILIVVMVLVVLLLGIGLSAFFLLRGKGADISGNKHYYVPDFEEDIFQNKAYMTFDRDLVFGSMGVEQRFNFEKDYETADPECRFFFNYFNTVILGEYQKLPSFYVEGFFEEEPKFTMQMIYEPYVLFHSLSTEEVDGQEISLINFHVEYKIFKNNGTFRSDVSSNTAVPQIYQLIKNQGGSYQIYRILDVKTENAS